MTPSYVSPKVSAFALLAFGLVSAACAGDASTVDPRAGGTALGGKQELLTLGCSGPPPTPGVCEQVICRAADAAWDTVPSPPGVPCGSNELCDGHYDCRVPTIDVALNDTHQTIDGFGVSQGQGYDTMLLNRPQPQVDEVMDLAFSQTKGIGLTIFRSWVAPGPWADVTRASLEPSKGTWNYIDDEEVALMKRATMRGPVKILATVSSPPAWMKMNTTGSVIGGALDPSHYQDYADYLAHYADDFARENHVQIYALSVQNEPDNSGSWPTCEWTGDELATFMGTYLAPAFASRGLATKIVAAESSNWDSADSFLLPVRNNAAAFSRLDIAAAHLYGGTPGRPIQNAEGKRLWMTEASKRHDPWSIDGAVDWASDIHDGLTGAELNAWIWWGLAAWRNDEFLMSLDVDTTTFSVSKTFWALGNYSKFIRPGYVRVGSTVEVGASVLGGVTLRASAFKDPATGRVVVVAINRSVTAVDTTLNVPGASGTVSPYITSETMNLAPQPRVSLASRVTIPPKSVVTYVIDPPQSGAIWRKSDGTVEVVRVDGDAMQDPIATGSPDTNWKIEGVGDFDGDGGSDLFWRCTGPSCWLTAHGQLAIWYGAQSTSPEPSYPGLVSDDGWQVQQIADFDGNGKSDVLWRYLGASGHGQLSIWWNGQSQSPAPAFPGVASDDGWQIKGVGDFDHNGKADILWRYFGSDNHGQLAIWWNGQSSTPPPSYPAGVSDDEWQIKGIGDFDGSGTSDILWQYAGQANHGQLAVWWNGQNTAPSAWYPAVVSDDNWVIRGIQDFNRDRVSDVLWQYVGPSGATTRGQLAIWWNAQNASPGPSYPGVFGDMPFQATGRF